jgi:hypothetical protein
MTLERNATRADRQKQFLMAFAANGTVKAAMGLAGIRHRKTVAEWRRDPEFLDEMENAARDFREGLEELAFSRLKDQSANSNPILLITMLNAHWPEKYRPGGTVEDDQAKRIQLDIRRLISQQKKAADDPEAAEVVKTAEDILKGEKPG